MAEWVSGVLQDAAAPPSLGMINTSAADDQQPAAETPKANPNEGYDLAGARAAGVPDIEIAKHLAFNVDYNIDGALKAGVTPEAIIDHLLPPPPPPPEAEPLTGYAKAVSDYVPAPIRGYGQSFFSGIGGLAKGVGDIAEAIGASSQQAAIDHAQEQKDLLTAFKAVDAGKPVPDMPTGSQVPDIAKDYANAFCQERIAPCGESASTLSSPLRPRTRSAVRSAAPSARLQSLCARRAPVSPSLARNCIRYRTRRRRASARRPRHCLVA